MANWIEIPGHRWINLDALVEIRVKQNHTLSSWQVEGTLQDGGGVQLAIDLRTEERGIQVARAFLRTGGVQVKTVDPKIDTGT